MTTTRVLVILSLTTRPSLVLMSATSPVSYAPARRSRRMVLARARSPLAASPREGSLAPPREGWKRRLNLSSARSRPFSSTPPPFIPRHAEAFIVFWGGATAAPPPDSPTGLRRSKRVRSYPSLLQGPGTGHELGLDADLLGGEAEALARRRLVHAFPLVHYSARLHHHAPELRDSPSLS